jgi:hypothetical protein
VTPIGDREVYDLQTSTQNFGTEAGVFVHNTYSVVKGQNPVGVSAGVSLQLLQERANSRFGSMYILWEQAWARWAQHQIEIFRQFATEARLLKIKGQDGRWQVQHFMAADLTGRVDIRAQAGSGAPRSTMVERAELEQAMQLGVLNASDPDTKMKILELLKHPDWMPGLRDDTKNAIMEDEAFEQLGQQAPPEMLAAIAQMLQKVDQLDQLNAQQGLPPVPYGRIVQDLAAQGIKIPRVRQAVDGHMVHASEHGRWLKSERSMRLPEPIQLLAERHKGAHDQAAQAAMQHAMQMREGTAQPLMSNPGGPGPGPGGPPGGGQGGGPGQHARSATGPGRMQGEMREMERAAA